MSVTNNGEKDKQKQNTMISQLSIVLGFRFLFNIQFSWEINRELEYLSIRRHFHTRATPFQHSKSVTSTHIRHFHTHPSLPHATSTQIRHFNSNSPLLYQSTISNEICPCHTSLPHQASQKTWKAKKKPKKCGFVWNWRLFVKMTDFCWSDGFMYKWRISGIDEEWYLCGSDVLKWRILKWRVLKWRMLKWEIPVNGMMAIFTYQNPRLDIIRYQAFLDDVTPETLRTEFLDDFRSLPTTFYHPVSPQMFQDFIKRWGTHIVKARDQRSN